MGPTSPTQRRRPRTEGDGEAAYDSGEDPPVRYTANPTAFDAFAGPDANETLFPKRSHKHYKAVEGKRYFHYSKERKEEEKHRIAHLRIAQGLASVPLAVQVAVALAAGRTAAAGG